MDTSKNNFDSIISEHSICYFLDNGSGAAIRAPNPAERVRPARQQVK
jgi:hypothetical protein